jgi:hypothetical protein
MAKRATDHLSIKRGRSLLRSKWKPDLWEKFKREKKKIELGTDEIKEVKNALLPS